MITVLDGKHPTKAKTVEGLEVEGREIRALMYDDASELTGAILNTQNNGYVECEYGSVAWTKGFENMKQFDSTGW